MARSFPRLFTACPVSPSPSALRASYRSYASISGLRRPDSRWSIPRLVGIAFPFGRPSGHQVIHMGDAEQRLLCIVVAHSLGARTGFFRPVLPVAGAAHSLIGVLSGTSRHCRLLRPGFSAVAALANTGCSPRPPGQGPTAQERITPPARDGCDSG